MADAQLLADFDGSSRAQLVADFAAASGLVGYRSHLGWMMGVYGVTPSTGTFNAYWAISSSRILGGGDR